MPTPNILTQIWTAAVKDWNAIASAVETDIAKVEAVLPGAAPIVADVKQMASNALGVVVSVETTYEPQFVAGLEGLADAAMTKYSGGLALPLVPTTNAGIQKIASDGQAWFQAWALKMQAMLAENNAALGGGTPAKS